MNFRAPFLIVSAVIVPATASFADVSPLEVWNSWQTLSQSMGQTFDGRVEQTGDTLIAHDVTISMPYLGGEFMTFTGTTPKIVFEGQNDGTVEVTLPDPTTYTTSIKGDLSSGVPPMTIRSAATFDSTTVASGTVDNITYEVLPGTMTYVTQKQMRDGIVLVPEQIVTVLGVQGTMSQETDGDTLNTTAEFAADSVSVDSDSGTDDIAIDMAYTIAPLNFVANFTTSAAAMDEPLGYLKSMDGTAGYSLGRTAFEMNTTDGGQVMTFSGSTRKSAVGARMSRGVVSYLATAHETDMTMSGSGLPMPQIDFGIGEARIGVTLPLLKSDTPKPFAFKMALEELRLPDMAWMMLDPQGQMPRDPATIRLDLSGSLMAEADLLNPQAIIDMVDDEKMPFMPLDMALNELYISLAGATFTGTGAAVIAKGADMFEGFPFESANASLALNGGTTLMDTLAQTGLIPPQMSMTAKMMLGMWAKPGDTPDSYTADIDLNKDGALSVNGQPLPF